MVKQEIKEDTSLDIDEQNITKIINLKEFSKPVIDPPPLQKKTFWIIMTVGRIS